MHKSIGVASVLMMALESKAIKITVEGELTEVKDLMEHSNMMMQVDVKEGKND